MRTLAFSAAACLALGLIIHPWNPIVKKICTTSFTLYSTGWVLLMLLAFYWAIEVKGYRKWAFPLLVVGANSIFIYSLEMVLYGWLNRAVGVFTYSFAWLGGLRAGGPDLCGPDSDVGLLLLALSPEDLFQSLGSSLQKNR